jgi:K+-sensing histidine kinase KdpD
MLSAYIYYIISYFLSKSPTKRVPFVLILFCALYVGINDTLVSHNIIKLVMKADFYIFILVAFIFYEFLREDQKTYLKVVELNKKLKELDVAKSYFLNLISHELSTPLIGINGNAKLIKEFTNDNEIVECAEHILASEARLRKFSEISHLITSIQTDHYHKKFTDENIIDLINTSVYHNTSNLNDKSIRIDLKLNSKEIYRKVDYSLMLKVIDIILDNAIKFSPENSIIHISDYTESNKYCVKIKDSGIGFSEKSLINCFEMFSSTENILEHSEGTGLSLTAAKLIINMHNFELLANNSENNGAEITLIF